MDFYEFIEQNLKADPLGLRLSTNKKSYDFDVDFAITQIEARKKFEGKLSKFISNKKFLFPDLISGEQSSHQAVASFHSSLIKGEKKILDMTAGLGIDTLSMAQKDVYITAVELNPEKAGILKDNANNLNLPNVEVINGDSMEYLKSLN